MKIKLLLAALSLLSAAAQAQIANPGFADSTSGVKLDKVHISGYLDTYVGLGPRTAGSMPGSERSTSTWLRSTCATNRTGSAPE
ncbi:MAG: hypothetical protein ACO204_07975 [Schleiferiaceae bacterium]